MRLVTIFLSVLFLFSSLYMTDTFNSVGNIIISFLIISCVFLVFLFKKQQLDINTNTLLLMYLLMLSGGISALLNSEFQILLSFFALFALYFVGFVVLPSFKMFNNKIIYRAIFYSHTPIILAPILFYGFNSNPYRGIFYNPNAFGTVLATLYGAFFSVFLYNMEKYISGEKRKLIKTKLFGQLLLALFMIYLVILSSSRTSAITVVVISMVGMFFLIVKLIKERKIGMVIFRGGLISILGTIVVYFLFKFTSFYEYLYLNIIYKFERKIRSGDVLDQRGEVWKSTVDGATVFGNGKEFFTDRIGLGAHNTFVGILGEYGWISLILFLFLLLFIFIKSYKYATRNKNDKYKYLPLMMFFSFVTLSMGEGMLFKLSMIAMFLSAGTTIQKDAIHIESEYNETVNALKGKKSRRRLVW